MRRFPKTVETVRSQLLKFKKEIWVVVEHNRSGLKDVVTPEIVDKMPELILDD